MQIETERVVRAYEQVWAERDAVRRRSLMAESMTRDVEILGPGYDFKGYDAVAQEVERMHREHPGVRAAVTSGLDVHHNLVRFAFAVVQFDGSIIKEGEDVLLLAPDGRIRKVLTFFGVLPPLPSSWPAELVASLGNVA
jgi:hypothetical protein